MNPMQARAVAEKNAKKCFACAWILADLEKNGKLTDWPYDYNGKGEFPVDGKRKHLEVESLSIENRLTS